MERNNFISIRNIMNRRLFNTIAVNTETSIKMDVFFFDCLLCGNLSKTVN